MVLLNLEEALVGHHADTPLGAGLDQLAPPLMEMQQIRKFKFLAAFFDAALVRLLWPGNLVILGCHVSRHPVLLVGRCLKLTPIHVTLHHPPPLGSLLGDLSSHPKPTKRTSLLGIEMDPVLVSVLEVFVFKNHITVLTLEPLSMTRFDVVLEIL